MRIILIAACVLLLIVSLPPFFSLFAPFIFAYLVAMILNPIVSKLHEKFNLPRKASAFILVILVFLCLASVIGWFIYRAVNEAVSLAMDFPAIWDSVMAAFDYVNGQLEWLLEILPDEMETVIVSSLQNIYLWLRTASLDFVNFIVVATPSLTTKVGSLVLSIVASLLATYFITAEYNALGEALARRIGDRPHNYMKTFKDVSLSALVGYLRAQLILALLALSVMFAALAIYGQRYAFIIALILGLIDFLPILGTSAVLVPWGLVEIAGGDSVKGLFLLILAAAFFVLRKIVEPRIVGSQTGLHPLIALITIFVGFKIFGVLGAILGPLVLMIAINFAKTHVFDSTIADAKAVWDDLAPRLQG
ncbi:MAG: sporulation integral membrane protein YtvI [Clostridiales bacterium]|nr:sporulation integral membrane protein YtvI [Clostridiales bacterium]